jgi:hypothetical protein
VFALGRRGCGVIFEQVGGKVSMRNDVAFVGAMIVNLGLAGVGAAQTDPNPAVNDPDRQSWKLFMTVNANAASAGK